MEKESSIKSLSIGTFIDGLNKNITYIDDDHLKGDESQIFAKYKERNFINFFLIEDGKKIKMATYKYVLTKSPKAIIIFFHGLSGTMKTSGYLAKSLAEEGFLFVGYDFRGHGKSEGKKMYFESSEQIVNDSLEFIELMIKLYPNLPLIIGGNSFGGYISYQLSLRYKDKFKGVFLFAPALKPLQGWFIRSVAYIVGSIMPFIVLTNNSNKNQVTKNKFAIEKNDKKNKKKSTPISTLKAVLKGMSECEETFHLYESNVIVFMGGMDKVVNSNVTFNFILNSKSVKKKLYYYKNLYHNVLLEVEIYDIIVKLKDWLNSLNL